MKRTTTIFTRTLSLLLCLLMVLSVSALVACTKLPDAAKGTETTKATATEAAPDANAPEVRGTGAVSFSLTVTDLDGTQKEFTVKTDEKNVADALVKAELVSGDDSEYGLYIKVVNGITADYNVDQTYWALLVDGEMSMVGASSVPVTEGLRVELKKTK